MVEQLSEPESITSFPSVDLQINAVNGIDRTPSEMGLPFEQNEPAAVPELPPSHDFIDRSEPMSPEDLVKHCTYFARIALQNPELAGDLASKAIESQQQAAELRQTGADEESVRKQQWAGMRRNHAKRAAEVAAKTSEPTRDNVPVTSSNETEVAQRAAVAASATQRELAMDTVEYIAPPQLVEHAKLIAQTIIAPPETRPVAVATAPSSIEAPAKTENAEPARFIDPRAYLVEPVLVPSVPDVMLLPEPPADTEQPVSDETFYALMAEHKTDLADAALPAEAPSEPDASVQEAVPDLQPTMDSETIEQAFYEREPDALLAALLPAPERAEVSTKPELATWTTELHTEPEQIYDDFVIALGVLATEVAPIVPETPLMETAAQNVFDSALTHDIQIEPPQTAPTIVLLVAEHMQQLEINEKQQTAPLVVAISTTLHRIEQIHLENPTVETPEAIVEQLEAEVIALFERLQITYEPADIEQFIACILRHEFRPQPELASEVDLEKAGTHEGKWRLARAARFAILDIEQKSVRSIGKIVLFIHNRSVLTPQLQ